MSDADRVVRLKAEADAHWQTDPARSLSLADEIVAIGAANGDVGQVALGTMARGDALKFLERLSEAWEALEEAGRLFRSIGDEVGWARTRIGRLYVGVLAGRAPEALADMMPAAITLQRAEQPDLLIRLYGQTAYAHNVLGEPARAMPLLDAALDLARQQGASGAPYLSLLHLNKGVSAFALGDLGVAQAEFTQARDLAHGRGETITLALAEADLADVHIERGQHRQALLCLDRALSLSPAEQQAKLKLAMVVCYLQLQRMPEALELLASMTDALRAHHDHYNLARARLYQALALTAVGQNNAAGDALEEASRLYDALDSRPALAKVQLWRSRVALHQGAAQLALEAAREAGRLLAVGGRIDRAAAQLLEAQAVLRLDQPGAAERAGTEVLAAARDEQVPVLRYSAHLVLGRVAEHQARLLRASRHYRAATAVLERVQRDLTLTLRPGFLADKDEALHALIGLYLRQAEAAAAWSVLERAKSYVWRSYLTGRDRLVWAGGDRATAAAVERLELLRAEHHACAQQLDGSTVHTGREPTADQADREQLRARIRTLESQMRSLTERLYLHAGQSVTRDRVAGDMHPDQILASLQPDECLLEYYDDGRRLWAFSLAGGRVRVDALPASGADLARWLRSLQLNLGTLLTLSADPKAQATVTASLLTLLKRLHAVLLAPLAVSPEVRRLIIVPYGVAHVLPFHLLHDGQRFVFDAYEVITLPAAAVRLHPAPQRAPGALAVACSWEGRLPLTEAEAEQVVHTLGGQTLSRERATRGGLAQTPRQVLHIAAHGQYRPDAPELSHLQLYDGPLYADDLFQLDLSYELVTLSACETGRVTAVAHDELIGLSRGFLYAGAGALVHSLWRIPDSSALTFMSQMYAQLAAGASKAAAVRSTMLSQSDSNGLTAIGGWGAFQLVGAPGPLTPAGEMRGPLR